jgi:hypothetical protein
MPTGRYTVQFAATSCGANPGNWAPQWYKGAVRESAATPVRVVAGQVTRRINTPQWYKSSATPAAATTVTVRGGQDTTGIDAALAADGGLSGQVTAAPPVRTARTARTARTDQRLRRR